jgi:aspartate/methionine/tyrosine aminotransferase
VAGLLFADPGDEIILPDRFWDNYTLLFEHLCGAALKTYATFKGNAFDTKSFRTALLARTGKRIILFNFPNNPSGYSPTAKEVQEIVDAIRASAKQGSTVIVILDDAYFGLVYEQGVERESLLSYLADLHERVLVVKIDGATKEDFVWGHRVAFITFAVKGMSEKCAKALEAKAAGTVRETTSNAPHLSQSLLLKLYASPEYREQKKHAATVLERRYLAVCDAVKGGKYDECFRALPFNSGYFMCVELAKGLDAETVRRRLLEKYGTGVIALGNLLRVAYSSLPEDSIGEVFSNIAAACRELSLSPS